VTIVPDSSVSQSDRSGSKAMTLRIACSWMCCTRHSARRSYAKWPNRQPQVCSDMLLAMFGNPNTPTREKVRAHIEEARAKERRVAESIDRRKTTEPAEAVVGATTDTD
jgi:hypothetical protein